MKTGALFGVPIPEKYEAVGKILQEAVEVALAEAEQNGINKRGKEATPWLLKRVGELTKGTSLSSSQWFSFASFLSLTNMLICRYCTYRKYRACWYASQTVSAEASVFTNNFTRRRSNSCRICEAVGSPSGRTQ